jgi:hypothetical protein
MAEYVEREALKRMLSTEKFCASCSGLDEPGGGCAECVADYIESLPAADVAPVRRGQWKPTGFTFMGKSMDCPECGYRIATSIGRGWNYCPNCGAKMEVGNG